MMMMMIDFTNTDNIGNIIAKEKPHGKETVLVLQGGGSLGAYECGVFKIYIKTNIVLISSQAHLLAPLTLLL